MKPSRIRPSVAAGIASPFAILMVAGILSAHDFWLVPNAFTVAGGGSIEVRGQTSSRFPTSESAVVPERVAEARVIAGTGDTRVTDLSVSEKSLLLRHKPAGMGQHIVAVALVARTSKTTPAGLKRYIALEGNTALAERYEREGTYPKVDSLTQRAAKFAKTIVEVGRGGPRLFDRVVGHLLELVPLNDPALLRAGDSLTVRLIYRGQPVAGTELHAGAAPDSSSQPNADARPKDLGVVTNSQGVARIPLNRSGLWNVRTLYAAPGTSAIEWDVSFVTLVFEVAPGGSAPRE